MQHWLLVMAVWSPLSAFAADGRVNFLSRQLTKASDPRARAQAALLLGQSQESAATEPLCQAVKGDAEDMVRAAAAKALAQLGEPSALGCLLSVEARSKEVSAAVNEAVAFLRALRSQKPVFYVALGAPENRANLGPELLTLLEERMRARLARMGSLFAPPQESRAQANKVLKGQKLKGYLLAPAVQSHNASGLKLTVVCFSYPERELKGEISVKASGASQAELIKILASRAIDDVADEFEWKD